MSEKIIGYLFTIIGTLIIVFAGFSVYQVFTAKQKPVELFHFPAVSINMGSLMGSGEGLSPEQLTAFEKQKSQIKPQEIISADMVNVSSNIAAHMLMMGFIASIGYKIASLGIQFLRPVVVRLKESKEVLPVVKSS